jgi:hypothetical protein
MSRKNHFDSLDFRDRLEVYTLIKIISNDMQIRFRYRAATKFKYWITWSDRNWILRHQLRDRTLSETIQREFHKLIADNNSSKCLINFSHQSSIARDSTAGEFHM